VATSCPADFVAYQDGCYYFSEDTHHMMDCQRDVCGPLNATLVTITNHELNGWLSKQVMNLSLDAAWIGLFERGEDESGDWVWVNGSRTNVSSFWQPGQPDNACVDEDCVVLPNYNIFLFPVTDMNDSDVPAGWTDVACFTLARCICQTGGNATSEDFKASEPNLTATGGLNFMPNACSKAVGPGGLAFCFWYRDTGLKAAFSFFAFPCLALMIYAFVCSCGTALGMRTGVGKFDVETDGVVGSPYGQLLDMPEGGAGFEFLGQWVVRGAIAEIAYAMALLLLALCVLLHINHWHFSFMVDAFAALTMCICKSAVALSIHIVSCHLSSFAKAVAGPWVSVHAMSMTAMAFCALMLVLINVLVFDENTSGKKMCYSGYIFMWSLLASFVCQCASGFAVFRVHERAAGYVEDSRVFSRVVGCNWTLLVNSMFGVGLGLGVCAAFFVFDDPTDRIDPFHAVPGFYALAAVCQIASGFALYMGSKKVKAHFVPPESPRTIHSAVEMMANLR